MNIVVAVTQFPPWENRPEWIYWNLSLFRGKRVFSPWRLSSKMLLFYKPETCFFLRIELVYDYCWLGISRLLACFPGFNVLFTLWTCLPQNQFKSQGTQLIPDSGAEQALVYQRMFEVLSLQEKVGKFPLASHVCQLLLWVFLLQNAVANQAV